MMIINVERVTEGVSLPEYQHEGEDAGLDLRSREEGILEPGEFKLFKTGIKVEIPYGYMGKICPRSGLAYKKGITVLNAEGTIDPGYRGEIGVILINHGDETFKVKRGDRIAQFILEEFSTVEWQEIEDINETERGDGGFGSTGEN